MVAAQSNRLLILSPVGDKFMEIYGELNTLPSNLINKFNDFVPFHMSEIRDGSSSLSAAAPAWLACNSGEIREDLIQVVQHCCWPALRYKANIRR